MNKCGTVRVAVLSVALVLSCSAAQSDSDGFSGRIERAAVEGSVAKLQAIRSALLKQTAVEQSEASSAELYTLAYIGWRIVQLLDDDGKKEKKRLLKEAQKQLEIVIKKEPENAEAYALRSGVIGQRPINISGFRSHRLGLLSAPPVTPSVGEVRAVRWLSATTPTACGGLAPPAPRPASEILQNSGGD